MALGKLGPFLFMGKLRDFADRVRQVTVQSQESAILEILHLNQNYILDLETFRLMRGILSNGNDILPAYKNGKYAQFKLSLNAAGVVDLHLTGAFYEGFFVDTSQFPLVFGSTDEKSDELVKKYTSFIFGLDNESRQELIAQIITQVQQWYRQAFGL